ncbi:MAG TPA: hypothetical protein VGH20_22090 [Myxococcales bacterium]
MALVITVVARTSLLACPMCFGAADSGQVQAAKIGILVLLGCIVPILLAIAFTARSWAKRARELERAEEQSAARLPQATAPRTA